ncbi:MAG TPA: acetylxylan esterase [Chloroflexota bacterium]|nr:acetylxylan esterase [Chloroflexota bacterium]
MPIFEMPLAELQQYRGSSPRPPDIDRFWDAAVGDMRAVDPDVTLRPHPFPTSAAEMFDLTFTGVGGARVYAKYLRLANGSGAAHPAILLFHGYAGNSGDWGDKLAWVAQGYSVAAMDVRGQGGSSQDTGGTRGNTLHGHIIRGLDDGAESLLFRSVFLDTAQLAGIVLGFPEVDETRVGAMGASQGGALTVACAALEPRIALAAPTFPFLSDYRRVWGMDLDVDAYAELREYLRLFDPTHERIGEMFARLAYIDIQNLAHRIRARILWTTGLMDTICPPSTQFAVYNKITAPKEMIIYPDFGHEDLPGLLDRQMAFFANM